MKNQNLDQTQMVTEKRKYNRPEITVVEIDNEISMVMMSAGPQNDPEEVSINPGNFNFNPFKMLKF